MRNLHIVIFLFILQFCNSTIAQNPYIRHYTTNDGLPSNTIYQMCQDSHKFLWFTSDAGVVKFDGTNFTSYRKKDGLSSNDVVRIKEDAKGRIWFFNYNGSVNYYFNNKIYNGVNASFLNLLTGKGFFLDFFTDSSGTIYFYNYQREVFILDTANRISKVFLLRNINIDLPLIGRNYNKIRVSYLSKSISNKWLIWASCGVYSQDILTGKFAILDNKLYSRFVFPARNNTIYVLPYDLEDGIIKVTSNNQKEKISFPGNAQKIITILEDSEGYLWISTIDEGVFCLKNNKVVKHFDIKNATGLLQDHEQNIWVSTQSDGIYLINHEVLTQNHFDRTYFDNTGVNLLCDFPGMGIMCLNGKTVYLLVKDDIFYKLPLPKAIQPLDIIYLFKNKTLLLGRKSNWLYTYKNIRLAKASEEIYYASRRAYPIPIKKVINDRTGLVSTIFDQNRFMFNKSAEPLFNAKYNYIGERINNAFYNAQNEFVINGKRNYVYRNNQLEPYNELSRFNGSIISDHLVLNDEVELFNIDGDSLYLFKNHSFYNLTKAFIIPISSQIKKIVYKDSTLYLATHKDVFVCENLLKILSGNTILIHPLSIGFNNINDILVKRDSLYIASDDGLTIIPRSSFAKNIAVNPVPYLQSVIVNDNKYALPVNELKLTGKNNIQLTFGCISYISNAITYSYILEGAGTKWNNGTGNEINLFYRNLSPGEYSFKLKVRMSNSDWSEPLVLPIIIKPTLTDYPAFWFLIFILAGVLIVLFIYRYRTLRIRRIEIDHQLVVLEQKALQSMMNPHFIFNSLGSIQNYLLKNKVSEAVIYLSDFARLIRQNLNAANTPMIILEEEVERLKNYLDLEKIRLENKFDYSIEIDPSLEDDEVYIPGMIIQPIAENAIWHGIATIKEQGNIAITFQAFNSKSLKISIADNGIGMKQSLEDSTHDGHRQHLGMQMIKKRLELLGRKHSIKSSIGYSEINAGAINPGTLVELIVPFAYSPADL